jgi:splicing factor 3A subunit 1
MVITGVIRPPPEIRAVADRTALYVAKNGRAFEARILKSEKAKTPKFAFLQPTSPFHAYYEDRIQFYEAGGEDGDDNDTNNKKEGAEKKENTTAAPKETTTVRKTEKTQKASAIDPIAKALLGQRNKIQQARAKQKEESKEGGENGGGTETTTPSSMPLPPPPPLELVTIVAPSNLSVVQIETIQLVAQFAAMDGKGGPFLQQLTLREWTNTAFSFCQPRHAHFAYFSALVDAYRRILGQWTTAAANFKSMESSGTPPLLDVQASLQEAAYRAEYERELLQMKSQQEEGEVVAIDWQDFVVVETIDFPVDEKVELSMLPPPPPPKIQEQPPSVAAAKTEQHEGMEESDDDEDEEETIRVVPSYTPKVVGTANPLQARAIDPITGKSVSVADMPEHMRIQLMDPKWAEERKKFQEKQKDSNLVSGDAIASNISRFAQARGDLFGKSVSLVLRRYNLF